MTNRVPYARFLPLFAGIVLVLLAALPVLSYPMGRDQGMYANIGRVILSGGNPYIDMWDIKPPPIYYIYAAGLAIFGQTTAAIRAIDFIAVPLGMIGLFSFGNLLAGRKTAFWAALIYGVFYFTESFASLTQNDTIVTVPMIWAAFFALRATHHEKGSRHAIRDALITGLLCGIFLWFKHYNAFIVVAFVLFQLIARRSFPIKEALAFVIGGLLTGGALLLFFWSQGMVQEMLIVAEGTAAYNAQGYQFERFLSSMGNYLWFRWQHWGVMLILVALWLPSRFLTRTQHAASLQNMVSRKISGWWLVVLWLLAGIAFMLIQSLGFDTHWIPMLPPLALFAGDALARLLDLRFTRVLSTLALIGLLCVVGYSTWRRALPYYLQQETQSDFFAKFQGNDLKPAESLEVVNYLKERVAPGDTMYIWGFRPEVMFMGGWRPATRFQAQFPLVADWYPQAWLQQNVDVLWAALPPYVLALEDDFMPWVTGENADSHTLLQDYTELNNWLIFNYDRDTEIGDFLIWRRKTP